MGSGWLPAAEALGDAIAEVTTTDLPGFAPPAVEGHAGKIRSIAAGDSKALVFLGRTHYYEGRGVAAVVHGVRMAAAAGCRAIVLTNGCGGLRPEWQPGTAGADQGPHQPDGDVADRRRELRRPDRPLLAAAARAVQGGRARASTRASTSSSPGRTTRPRPRSRWSAASAATSPVCRPRSRRSPRARPGMEILGISLVTNAAAGMSGEPLDHEEVLAAGNAAASRMGELLVNVVPRI